MKATMAELERRKFTAEEGVSCDAFDQDVIS